MQARILSKAIFITQNYKFIIIYDVHTVFSLSCTATCWTDLNTGSELGLHGLLSSCAIFASLVSMVIAAISCPSLGDWWYDPDYYFSSNWSLCCTVTVHLVFLCEAQTWPLVSISVSDLTVYVIHPPLPAADNLKLLATASISASVASNRFNTRPLFSNACLSLYSSRKVDYVYVYMFVLRHLSSPLSSRWSICIYYTHTDDFTPVWQHGLRRDWPHMNS